MSKRAVIWSIAALAAAVVYAIYFTPLFQEPQMQLSVRYTVPPGSKAKVLNVVFSLDRMYELTAVRVVSLPPPPEGNESARDTAASDAAAAAGEPRLVWELVGAPNSQAISAFRFGQSLEGMTENTRQPLEPGKNYRMTIESHDVQASIEFLARPNTHNTD